MTKQAFEIGLEVKIPSENADRCLGEELDKEIQVAAALVKRSVRRRAKDLKRFNMVLAAQRFKINPVSLNEIDHESCALDCRLAGAVPLAF